MASEQEICQMAKRIQQVMKETANWKQDHKIVPEMQSILGKLTAIRVDADFLKRTQIGAMVNKLRKHSDDVVAGYSASLTDKWRQQVGLPSKPKNGTSSSGGGGGGNTAGASASASSSNTAQASRLEDVRRRIKENYATERQKRADRNIQVLSGPPLINRRRKSTVISSSGLGGRRMPTSSASSAAGPRKNIRVIPAKQTQRSQQTTDRYNGPSGASNRAPLRSPASRVAIGASSSGGAAPRRSPMASSSNARMTEEERHLLRRQKFLKLAQQSEAVTTDVYVPPEEEQKKSSSRQATPRGGNAGGHASAAPKRAREPEEQPVMSDRKAMLNRMFPRVCGVGASEASNGKRAAKAGSTTTGAKASSASSSSRKKKQVEYNENQREVLEWLRSVDETMTEYAPAFFDNGFDSMKLLTTIEPEDIPSLVPKKGHHRLLSQALEDLKAKRSTSAKATRGRDDRGPRARSSDRSGRSGSSSLSKKKRLRPAYYNDEEDEFDSEDSFVVSDGDEYAPGAISAMMFKRRGGGPRRERFDSADSSDMEASFEEIQQEELRSSRVGEYEDYREELRNQGLLKKKKKKD